MVQSVTGETSEWTSWGARVGMGGICATALKEVGAAENVLYPDFMTEGSKMGEMHPVDLDTFSLSRLTWRQQVG